MTKTWDNGAPEFTYHRFWSQVDMATAYAEYDRLINTGSTPTEPVAPQAPSKPSAVAGDSVVDLTWNNVTGAQNYTVKRGVTSGGPYTNVAVVTQATYSDTTVVNGADYYYVVSASNVVGESPNSPEVHAKPIDVPIPVQGDLVVKYRTSDTNPTDNQFRPQLQIVNNGTTAVALSNVKLRYYYTIDGEKPQQFNVDYATIGGSNVQGTFVKVNPAVTGADYYLEISFGAGAGSLAPGANTGDIQIRVNKSDWSNYNETGDYSYDATKTSYTEWQHVPLYLNGTLVWGLEP